MLLRILGTVVVIAAALLAALFVWPQAAGLQNEWVFAHVVALRGVAAAAALAGAVVFAAIALARRFRVFAGAMAAVLAASALGNAAVLGVRGIGGADAEAPSDLTVLSWNTLGEVPSAEVIAGLAVDSGADVVVLPETTEALGEEIAVEMREAGSPMWVWTTAFDEIAKARSTTLLISPELGDYEVVSAEGSGPPGNTNTLPTVVAAPVDGEGPTIVAVHAVAPIRWEMRNWRSDLDWLAEQCSAGEVVMAGDFNATIDHFAGRGVDGGQFGRCADAADAAGAAGLGTWPTDLPKLLGSPIDHVLASPEWRATSFEVVGAYDDAGSDHRPVVARLVRAG
ncbi:endonuclease/exonuclease/phosphatase family protein [Agromyces archimandritae]|uniref:Endonuclease/exonuclease/phosphatase family protein n=1 Tax=Agromyces archimandritae TaxID=2781962 RepID=A0A975FLU6_9MICO|nr:endonuclease/exonuclease/phosphatase family protein [Agromyces archimandritae]QTX04272.1 endonuclease/exonuclease/phosphatase family protein [Agromyces archimandritae]